MSPNPSTSSPVVNFLDFLDNEKEKEKAVSNAKQLAKLRAQLESKNEIIKLLKKQNKELLSKLKR